MGGQWQVSRPRGTAPDPPLLSTPGPCGLPYGSYGAGEGPEAAGGTGRRIIPGGVVRLPFELPPDDDGSWAAVVRETAMRWARFVARLARRKCGRGILSRSISFAMARPRGVAHLKLLFLEERVGEADAAVHEVCQGLGATVLGDKRLPTAELAVLQLMEDTTAHLA